MANNRLRRSRQWKDQSENKSPNPANANAPMSPVKATPAKNTRRRGRPTKSQQRRRCRPTKSQQRKTKVVVDCDDASTASTASTSLPSDDSLSGSSFSTPTKSAKRTPIKPRRKRSKKNKSKPKVVEVLPDLTPEEKSQYIALDAEMVGVGYYGSLSRLARVSLVNYDGETIYDTFVKVEEPVTDYRTFVSGITAEDLASEEAISFDECQSQVAALIQDKIVVGHGLRNDFKVLYLFHPWQDTRDTARYEPFMQAVDPNESFNGAALAPKKLKELAKNKLGMIIQDEGQPHSPVDDAVAALELYKKHRAKWEKVMSYKIERTVEIIQSEC